ncbi:MAG: ribonuclease III domain-containing protein [Lachnospiraceae bacterium]|nr:ribonuclease III domain-containing protein [Lachnospiraceae bacterium]
MEESLTEAIREQFDLHPQEASEYSPLVLAWIGDVVYELTLRTMLISGGNRPVDKLNRADSRLARAGAQSAMADALLPVMSEEEQNIYKRGRNAHSYTKAKSATTGEYRRATGFEAVIGYLYLKGRYRRLEELIAVGIKSLQTGKTDE